MVKGDLTVNEGKVRRIVTMPRLLWVLGGLILLCAMFIGLYMTGSNADKKIYPPDVKVLIQRFELRNQTGRLQKNVFFWVRDLVKANVASQLLSTTSNTSFHEQIDELGNRLLVFSVDHIPPFGSVIVENKARFVMGVRSQPLNTTPRMTKAALQPAPLIETKQQDIRNIAQLFTQENRVERAKAIYSWIVDHIKIASYQSLPQGAGKTLRRGKGDCTDFAHLYVALARASGIPSRVMAGYQYQGRSVMGVDDLHNWAEVLLEGRWRVVDAYSRQFLQNEDHYLAVLRLNMKRDGILRGHQRFKVSNADIHVQQF